MSRSVVVHILGSLDHGGAEKVALDLCRRIPPADVTQVFFCFSGREGALVEQFRAAGAIVVAAPSGGVIARIKGLRAVVARYRADVVVSHVSLASAFLLGAVGSRRVPTRIARGHSTGDDRGALRRWLYRATARAVLPFTATHVLGVSRSALDFLIGPCALLHRWRGVNVAVLVNGVDIERFHPGSLPAERTVLRIAHVGRASPEKNRRAIVPIVRSVNSRVPVETWIIGPGGVEDLGPLPDDGSFRLVGAVDDVASLLREVDVLILPSLREGLPGVVLEALASGVPVVASDLPTLREIVHLAGLTLVPVEASPEVWAGAIVEALDASDDDRAAIVASMARSEFTLQRSVDAWRALW